MYTILINNDKSLTTSVKSTLIRGTTTDEIAVLYLPPSDTPDTSPEASEDVLEEGESIITVDVEKEYTALLRYETDGIIKSENLITDEEFYKGRVRFIMPRSSVFFRSRGRVQVWVELTTVTTTITTTTTIDPDTGEEITDSTIDTDTETFTTLPTFVFIEEVPLEKNCPWYRDDNTIRITRGDSLAIAVELTTEDGQTYIPVEGDEILFTVKKTPIAEDILIQKQIDPATLILNLIETDTRDLAFGDYRYEIEIICATDDHYTVIKNAPFIIMEELHE